MKKYFLPFLFSICSFISCSQDGVTSINVEEFENGLLQNNCQLLDVRTANEYKSGHLKNALQANFNNTKEFNDRIQHLNKANPVYVYCLSGVRSADALISLKEQGFTKVYHLKGGINAWKQKNKFVEGSSNETQLSQKEYDDALKTDSLVLVDFGAEWCPPCKKMEPIIASLLKEIPQLKLFKVDGGVNVNLMKTMNVEALPVFIIYKNGQQIWRKQGIVSAEELKQQLK